MLHPCVYRPMSHLIKHTKHTACVHQKAYPSYLRSKHASSAHFVHVSTQAYPASLKPCLPSHASCVCLQGKGRRQQGAVFTGRMGGGPWAGCPSTHSLDLLDASMGALVHGTEDELSQVDILNGFGVGAGTWHRR
eukprot:scaffold316939_cov22-Tisochrysis_lutea.AAC.2